MGLALFGLCDGAFLELVAPTETYPWPPGHPKTVGRQ